MRVLLIITLLLALCAPASADWENTRWGMTPEEVAAVTEGTAQPSVLSAHWDDVPQGTTSLLTHSRRYKGWPGIVTYAFDSGGGLFAVVVTIEGDADTCWGSMYIGLLDRYGDPLDEGTEQFGNGFSSGYYRNWAHWPATDEGDTIDVVIWEHVGNNTRVRCRITYQPRMT